MQAVMASNTADEEEHIKDDFEQGATEGTSDESPQASTILAPSFAGRLNILDFSFNPQLLSATPTSSTEDHRRSSRESRSVRGLRSVTSSTPTSQSPLKRSLRRSQAATPDVSPPKRTSSRSRSPIPKISQHVSSQKRTNTDPRVSSLSSSSASSPRKKPRSRIPNASAEAYAHLPPLNDRLAPNLLVLFVGLNPGIQTAVQGHAYAHPSNLFWKLLHSSGITYRRHPPSDDVHLPRLYGLGNTNIVERPTRNGSELTKAEMDASVSVLEEKIRTWRPEVVCIVGKSIWESIWRVRHSKPIKKEEFRYGWQIEMERMGQPKGNWDELEGKLEESHEDSWIGARVFVACSTSGLAASLRPPEKEAIWNELGDWVKQRRREKGIREGEDFVEVDIKVKE